MKLKKLLKNLFQIDAVYRCKIGDDFYRADYILEHRLIICSPNEGSSGKEINKDTLIFYFERFILTLLEKANNDLLELVSETLTIYEDGVPVFEEKIGNILLNFNKCRDIIENLHLPYVSSLDIPGKVYALSSDDYSKSDIEKFRENCTIVGYHHYKWLVKIHSDEDYMMMTMAMGTIEQPRKDYSGFYKKLFTEMEKAGCNIYKYLQKLSLYQKIRDMICE